LPFSVWKALAKVVGVAVVLWLALGVWVETSPVVVLHYDAAAAKPIVYFFNEDDHVTKEYLFPGKRVEFRTPHRPPADYYIGVSLPVDGSDGVEIKPQFSRVDVYIGANRKITRTLVNTDFLARFSTE
jgi:hypothetical protein